MCSSYYTFILSSYSKYSGAIPENIKYVKDFWFKNRIAIEIGSFILSVWQGNNRDVL
jgi:hypothetical protein